MSPNGHSEDFLANNLQLDLCPVVLGLVGILFSSSACFAATPLKPGTPSLS
jgi:hypothetical protein